MVPWMLLVVEVALALALVAALLSVVTRPGSSSAPSDPPRPDDAAETADGPRAAA